jgi:hypothetical protein
VSCLHPEVSVRPNVNAGPMRLVWMLAFVALAPLMLSRPATAADAIASGDGGSLSLGSNWGAYETYRGASFRWVDNDAEIVLHGGTGEATVAIACEGGPSLGRRSFALRVLDSAHRQVDHVICDGADRRTEMLLPRSDGDARYRLHVDGGGKSIPGERRILNFRVFTLDDGRGGPSTADIVDSRSGVRLGQGWYPVEHYKGQTFRWMAGDGRIFVGADRSMPASLRMVLEVGPGVGSRQASIWVRDRHGRELLRTTIEGRRTVAVPVPLEPGENEFTISVASRNQRTPGEPRILNLRLFSAGAVR